MLVDKRLIVLRGEAWDKGLTGWVPRGVVAQLAAEFGVDKSVISKDIKIINQWPDSTPPPPPRQKLRDPRWSWAYSRPRPTRFPRQFTLMLPEEHYQALLSKGDPARHIRRAIETYLDAGSAHSTDDCAHTVAKACDLDTQDKIVRTAERLELPIWQVVTALLLIGSKREG